MQKNSEIFVVSNIKDEFVSVIYNDGFACCYSGTLRELIAEYPTWQEAVNSKEFKGE